MPTADAATLTTLPIVSQIIGGHNASPFDLFEPGPSSALTASRNYATSPPTELTDAACGAALPWVTNAVSDAPTPRASASAAATRIQASHRGKSARRRVGNPIANPSTSALPPQPPRAARPAATAAPSRHASRTSPPAEPADVTMSMASARPLSDGADHESDDDAARGFRIQALAAAHALEHPAPEDASPVSYNAFICLTCGAPRAPVADATFCHRCGYPLPPPPQAEISPDDAGAGAGAPPPRQRTTGAATTPARPPPRHRPPPSMPSPDLPHHASAREVSFVAPAHRPHRAQRFPEEAVASRDAGVASQQADPGGSGGGGYLGAYLQSKEREQLGHAHMRNRARGSTYAPPSVRHARPPPALPKAHPAARQPLGFGSTAPQRHGLTGLLGMRGAAGMTSDPIGIQSSGDGAGRMHASMHAGSREPGTHPASRPYVPWERSLAFQKAQHQQAAAVVAWEEEQAAVAAAAAAAASRAHRAPPSLPGAGDESPVDGVRMAEDARQLGLSTTIPLRRPQDHLLKQPMMKFVRAPGFLPPPPPVSASPAVAGTSSPSHPAFYDPQHDPRARAPPSHPSAPGWRPPPTLGAAGAAHHRMSRSASGGMLPAASTPHPVPSSGAQAPHRPPPAVDWHKSMLDTPVVRSILGSASAAMARHRRDFPEMAPDCLILVEISTKRRGISTTHDERLYDEYYQRVAQAIGERINSADSGSRAHVKAMVARAPPPEKSALQVGLGTDAAAAESSRHLGLPNNVAYTGAPESRLGAFEVYAVTQYAADGALNVPRVAGLHSKLWTRKFPNAGKLVRAAQALLEPVFRRHDGDLALRAAMRTVPLDRQAMRTAMHSFGQHASPEVIEEALNRLDVSDVADAALRDAAARCDVAGAGEDAPAAAIALSEGIDAYRKQASSDALTAAEARLRVAQAV